MKSLSKSSQIPLYQQVVEWIRESIYTGDLVEDDRIPSEYQIMDMLEVSRGTVKKAVAQCFNSLYHFKPTVCYSLFKSGNSLIH